MDVFGNRLNLKALAAIALVGKDLAEILYGPQQISYHAPVTVDADLRAEIQDDFKVYLQNELSKRCGFRSAVWRGLEKLNLDPKIPGLAELALDSLEFKIALQLGLDSDFSKARAMLLGGLPFNPNLNLNPSEAEAIAAMKLRFAGYFDQSVKLIEELVLPQITNIPDIRLQAEIYHIIGASYFSTGRMDKAIACYEKAFAGFEACQNLFRMVSAANNIATSSMNIYDYETHSKWTEIAKVSLKQIHFELMDLNIEVKECHALIHREKFEEAIAKSKQFLEKNNLTHGQRIELMQIIASGYVELGQIHEASIHSNRARQLIYSNKIYFLEIAQLSLEKNIETLCYVRAPRIGFTDNPVVLVDKIYFGAYRIAGARELLNGNNISAVRQQLADIKKDDWTGRFQSNFYIRDLELAANGYAALPERRARGLQVQLLQAMRHRDLAFMQILVSHMDENLKTDTSSWKEILFLLAKSYLQISQGLAGEAVPGLIRALDLTSITGLTRLYSIALGFLVIGDAHFEMQWLEHLKGLESQDRVAIQDFFKAAVGNQLSTLYLVISSNRRELSLEQDKSEVDLVINQETGEVKFRNEILPISGQSILFLLLNQLARSQKQGLTKEEIIHNVWGYTYESSAHDPLVYINIKRLRDLVPIEIQGGRYRISPQISWQFVVPSEIEDRKLNLTPRQVSIVSYIQKMDEKSASRSDIVSLLGISPRTALRELTEMVDKNYLTRHGAGRSARYTSN
jgi:tetratricopeptide (TPR) repeat protein